MPTYALLLPCKNCCLLLHECCFIILNLYDTMVSFINHVRLFRRFLDHLPPLVLTFSIFSVYFQHNVSHFCYTDPCNRLLSTSLIRNLHIKLYTAFSRILSNHRSTRIVSTQWRWGTKGLPTALVNKIFMSNRWILVFMFSLLEFTGIYVEASENLSTEQPFSACRLLTIWFSIDSSNISELIRGTN